MLRHLTIRELADVKSLFLDVFSNPPWNDRWPDDDTICAYLTELMDNDNALSLGYYAQDRLIGICLGYRFSWWQGPEYFVKEFCIARDLQGQGYGSRFLEEITNELKENGIDTLWLLTERSTPAHPFYLKNGFVERNENAFLLKNT